MSVSRSEEATAAALVLIGSFQVALAAGAPWGRAAYGGSHRGRLPGRLRAVSAVAACGYGTGALLVIGGVGAPRARARAFTGLSVLMGVATAVNGASRSPLERAVWTPVAAATAALAWRSRGPRV